MMWIAYASMWLATSAATSFGIYYTKSPQCLWALLIPTLVSFTANRNKR